MNKLSLSEQSEVIGAFVEGGSIRSVERITGFHRDEIVRLIFRVGEKCTHMMDESLRRLTYIKIQINELWCCISKNQRHVTEFDDKSRVGDALKLVALDPVKKLVLTFQVAKRTAEKARAFMCDLTSRSNTRCQLSIDSMVTYLEMYEIVFRSEVDNGQIVKSYEAEPIGPGRYSLPKVVHSERTIICGNPDPTLICTSHTERLNLTTLMNQRRSARFTNTFSKKLENLKAAVGLHFAHYNFARPHDSLRVTPAIEAGISSHIWSLEKIASLAA